MSDCKKYDRLLPLMLYGELDEEQKSLVQDHLRECQRCAAEMEELTAVLRLTDRAPLYEPSDALLARSRVKLHVRLREMERRRRPGDWLASARVWFGSYQLQMTRFATALAFVIVGVVAGRYLWPVEKPGNEGQPSIDLLGEQAMLYPPADAEIASIRFAPETGLVEVRYVTRMPVTLRGRPEDAPIRQVLARALRQRDPSLRLRAARALSAPSPPNEEVIDALLYALRTDSTLGVRLKLVQALKQISATPRVRDALIWTLLHDESEVVRMEAIDALTSLEGVAELAPIFQKTAREDTSVAVRTRAQRAIRRLENPSPLGL
jgi:hypothetical protein